jgi:hypothetical protein
LSEVFACNRGPTKVHECDIDTLVLADGLRGNSRLKIFKPVLSDDREVGNRQILAIAGAIRENKGLVALDLGYNRRLRHDLRMSDETWGAVCGSLRTHPTLEVLTLRPSFIHQNREPPAPPVPPAVLKSRIQELVNMLKVNTSIHTIRLRDYYREHELFRGLVIPHLETNRFRPCVRAIQKTRPLMYRAKVLGRALLAARTDPNRFWMLLSGNPEVAFPSMTAKTTMATNLPTPATATATSNAAAVAATVAATLADFTTGVSVADYVATPTVCQKRK